MYMDALSLPGIGSVASFPTIKSFCYKDNMTVPTGGVSFNVTLPYKPELIFSFSMQDYNWTILAPANIRQNRIAVTNMGQFTVTTYVQYDGETTIRISTGTSGQNVNAINMTIFVWLLLLS